MVLGLPPTSDLLEGTVIYELWLLFLDLSETENDRKEWMALLGAIVFVGLFSLWTVLFLLGIFKYFVVPWMTGKGTPALVDDDEDDNVQMDDSASTGATGDDDDEPSAGGAPEAGAASPLGFMLGDKKTVTLVDASNCKAGPSSADDDATEPGSRRSKRLAAAVKKTKNHQA